MDENPSKIAQYSVNTPDRDLNFWASEVHILTLVGSIGGSGVGVMEVKLTSSLDILHMVYNNYL